jgi:hypothetical protein
MSETMKTPLYGKILLMMISLLMSLAVIELGLRLVYPQQTYGRAQALTAGFYRESERLIWELLPNFDGSAQTNEGVIVEYQVHINSLGFRDEEFPLQKPENVYRIMTIGDSFTFGLAVDDGQDYPAQMETCLAERLYGPTRYEVINAGYASGFSPDSYYVFLDQIAPPYDIDFAIVGYLSVNDFLDLYDTVWTEEQDGLPRRISSDTRDLNLQGQLTFRDTLPRYRLPLLRDSHAFQLVMEVLLENTTGLEGAVTAYDDNPDLWYWVYLPQLPDELQTHFDTSLRMLTAMQQVSARDDFSLMVLLMPGGLQVHEPWWSDTQAYPNPFPASPENAYPQRAVRDYLDAQGIENYDLLPQLIGRRDLYNHPFGHWTVQGNHEVGQMVCNYMIDSHLSDHLLATGADGLRGISDGASIDFYAVRDGQSMPIGRVVLGDEGTPTSDESSADYRFTLTESDGVYTLTITDFDPVLMRVNADGGLVFSH